MPKKITIRIDGELAPTLEGKTILEAARDAGRRIPGLCHMHGLHNKKSTDEACRCLRRHIRG